MGVLNLDEDRIKKLEASYEIMSNDQLMEKIKASKQKIGFEEHIAAYRCMKKRGPKDPEARRLLKAYDKQDPTNKIILVLFLAMVILLLGVALAVIGISYAPVLIGKLVRSVKNPALSRAIFFLLLSVFSLIGVLITNKTNRKIGMKILLFWALFSMLLAIFFFFIHLSTI